LSKSCSSTTLETDVSDSFSGGNYYDLIRNSLKPSSADGKLKSSLKTSSTRGKQTYSVAFSDMEVRSYPLILGDNPSVSYGPPVCLDWKHESVENVSIDFYEENRGRRRKMSEMNLNYYARMDLLKESGYTEEEIKNADRSASRTKLKREITRMFLPYYYVEMAFESACRKAKRVTKRKKGSP